MPIESPGLTFACGTSTVRYVQSSSEILIDKARLELDQIVTVTAGLLLPDALNTTAIITNWEIPSLLVFAEILA